MRALVLAVPLCASLAACGPRSSFQDTDAGGVVRADGGAMGHRDAGSQPTGTILVGTVLDGDTVVLSAGSSVLTVDGRPMGGERVRLIGVDAPEIAKEGMPAQCWADEAKAVAEERLRGRAVTVEYDPLHCKPPNDVAGCRDTYGRLLAYVRIEGEVFNELLLVGGHARVFSASWARHRDSDRYATLESQARRNRVGLWRSCQ